LSAIGEASRISANILQPVAEWMLQQYKLLNLLKTLQCTPLISSHDGGERYKVVEITPWDEEWGKGTNAILGWAELGYFDPEQFEANGWNYIYQVNGEATAFSAADFLGSSFQRKHCFCAGSQWTFNLSLLPSAGLAFNVASLQVEAMLPTGCAQATPISNEFAATNNICRRAGYSAMVPTSAPTSEGLLTIEIGNDAITPSMPDYPTAMEGTNMRGWKLKSLGPTLVEFNFNFSA